jgi:Zn-dependent alcohol dehydrogenase
MLIKAPVLHRVREPQVVEEVEVEEPRPGEVLVRVVASGVCYSRLHSADGSWDTTRTPVILGDEGAWTSWSPGSTRSTRRMRRSATWPRASSPGA